MFTLTNNLGNKDPFESNIIVRNANTNEILSGADSTYYTLSNNNLRYKIPTVKFEADFYETNDFKVYLNGDELTLMLDYTLDLLTGEVILNIDTYVDGGRLIVNILPNAQYQISTDSTNEIISFASTPALNHEIVILSMYNHDVLDIERSHVTIETANSLTPDTVEYLEYGKSLGGILALNREVISDDFVLVIKNNILA